MSDFEIGIINACADVFPDVSLSCCLFHLSQSVYRKIQRTGLQQAYCNPDDDSLRKHMHMILALAYVPVDDVSRCFGLLEEHVDEDLLPVLEYFGETYAIGKPCRGRRRAVPPRYEPKLWNQYRAAIEGSHRTNNLSEGWHNRFRIVIGKDHPDLYSALTEFQKEQADTEIMITELRPGRRVKAAPKKKWLDFQERLHRLAEDYEDYKTIGDELHYLRLVSHYIKI